MTRRFEADLKRAIALGMSREIGRNAKGREDAEVQEVREVLQAHHETLVLVHAYYAATQSSELRYILLNGWTKYTEDFRFCRKSSKCCKKSDLDRLFIAVDTMSMMYEVLDKPSPAVTTTSTNPGFSASLFIATFARQIALK